MIVSTSASQSHIETCRSTLYAPSVQVPLMSWDKIHGNPVLQREYVRISETQVVPKSHITKNLRQMGSVLFNNPFSTKTCLHVVDKEGNSAKFWVHDYYFTHDSKVLSDLIRASTMPTSPMAKGNVSPKPIPNVDDCSSIIHVHLNVSYVESFSELLEWIYTRDDDAWLRSLNADNFEMAMENVALLRLRQDAYYVLARFYENM